ncbi:4'-phosphopantetheinyl transferase [Agaribacterium sp. ZY112]|uniref:4'-phosphopantetheinyl transferase family protein n=1 Tax=Agaribacterium sp. ZY112 TaxID=3233574 RepID=UPI00352677D9
MFIKPNTLASNFNLGQPVSEFIQFFTCDYALAHYKDDLFLELLIDFPASLQKSRNKRKSDFLAGRYCASLALKYFNYKNLQVPIGTHRSPSWPTGVHASISHCNGVAICAMAESTRLDYLGVDLECIDDVSAISGDIKTSLLSPSEEQLINSAAMLGSIDKTVSLSLVFSAKESLFKALYYSVACYFDFKAAELVELEPTKGSFTLSLSKELAHNLPRHKKIAGRFIIWEGYIVTCVYQLSCN